MWANKTRENSVGFIGLGLMGSPMVKRLVKTGATVRVWNRSPEKVIKAVANGAVAAASPAEVGRLTNVIILCLTDAEAVEAVIFGPDGISESVDRESIIVDTSTIGPEQTHNIADRLRAKTGARWVDAPVSGGVKGAESGNLAIMVGGSPEDIAQVQWALEPLARQVTTMGPVGTGQAAKLCNQFIICGLSVVIAEATKLAENAGIAAMQLPAAFGGGYADSVLLQRLVPPMAARDFQSSVGQVATLLKDTELARAMASRAGTPMPVSALAMELLRVLATRGAKEITQLIDL